MKSLVTILAVFLGFIAYCQDNIQLKINHKMGLNAASSSTNGMNNLGVDYKISRLQYYMTTFKIVHDGGMITDVPLEVVALLDALTESPSTTISLGSFPAVTNVEEIEFSIGVYEPVNNQDHTLYSEEHPLGPKSPEMFWGWASGYRFVAMEGTYGSDFSNIYNFHCLGNDNYFRQSQPVTVTIEGDNKVLNLDANYNEALRDMPIFGDDFMHGTTGAAIKVLENFRDYVFGNYYANLKEGENALTWSIQPNPAINKVTTVQFKNQNADYQLKVTNALGQTIQTIAVNNQSNLQLTFPENGIYFVSVISNTITVATERVVVQ